MSILSLQTWQIHALSLVEWFFAIELIWVYGNYIKSKFFLKICCLMIYFFVSAVCIIGWHYYSNNYSLIWLVIFQAFLTFLGNLSFSQLFMDKDTKNAQFKTK